MEASTDLHELIHSMSRTEKRYFKLFAKMQGKADNNYIRLFDAVNKQDIYDEEVLKRKFAKRIKQFGSTKFFLYKLILKSLRIFHSEDSVNYSVADQLREADLLIRRNLYEQANKLLDKCIETSEEYSLYLLLLIAYSKKQEIILQKGKNKNYLEELEKNCDTGLQVLKMQEEAVHYAKISAQFNYLSGLNMEESDESIQLIEELIQNDLLQNESQATTFDSKKIFYHIHTLYGYLKKDWRYMYDFAKKRVQLYEIAPIKIEHTPLAYIAALHNFMIACQFEGQFEEELEGLQKMRKVQMKRVDVQAKVLLQSLHFELSLHLRRKRKNETMMTAQRLRTELNTFGDKIAYELLLEIHIHLIAVFLKFKDNEKAYEHIELALGHSHILKEDMTYRNALILELLYHIAEGNDLLLPNKARAFYRYLQSQEKLSVFEKTLLEVARYQLPNATSKKERAAVLQSWKETIASNIEVHQQENPFLKYLDVLEWIEGLL